MSDKPRLLRRTVTLVLVTPDGDLLGALAPFDVDSPWWPETQPIIRAARARYSVDVIILRLLAVTPVDRGFETTYLAEVNRRVPALPWPGRLEEHPLRMPWARPGGPDADIEWARRALAECGLQLSGPPEQQRTWNLSSLWRLPLKGTAVWLKTVPAFFRHEGALLELLHPGPVPKLLAHDGRRMLLHDVAGTDMHRPTFRQRLVMVDQLVALQLGWIGRSVELLATGVPDWRGPSLTTAIRDVIGRVAGGLGSRRRRALERFGESLDDRFAEIAMLGIPDTLVHGDFHPGNHRGTGRSMVLLDWGDSGIGHPLLDMPAFFERVPGSVNHAVKEHWHTRWREALPDSDPRRAAELLAPIASARHAVIYQNFLDSIEPSEWPYHANDPLDWLDQTAALLVNRGH